MVILRSRDEFECKICGKKFHADVNASRNLLSRAKLGMSLRSVEQALIRQVEEFYRNLTGERFKCLRGKAMKLIESNRYFRSVSKPEVWINVNKKDICLC